MTQLVIASCSLGAPVTENLQSMGERRSTWCEVLLTLIRPLEAAGLACCHILASRILVGRHNATVGRAGWVEERRQEEGESRAAVADCSSRLTC